MQKEGKARYRYYKREFVYSFRKRIRFRRKKDLKNNYIERRLLKNFYLVLTYNNFRRFMNIAKGQKGYYIGNYLTLLEGRLFMISYRSNFITNIFLIQHVIKNGLFNVNGVTRNHFNFIIKSGDILQVNFNYKKLFYNDILLRLDNNIIFYRLPKYLFANYNFLFIFFWRQPKIKDLIFPITLDVLAGAEYYYP